MEVKKYIGKQILEIYDELAGLRIDIFKDFPYLYEGDMEYEREYLQTYSNSSKAMVVGILEGEKLIGATTCIPLEDETAEVQKPFFEYGYDISEVFYFGESILKREFRGRGLGNLFFDEREKYAQSFSKYKFVSFCAVQRPPSHPLSPQHYVPLDEFWRKRGFTKAVKLKTEFKWRDIGDEEESVKPMQFWLKKL